MGQLLLFFLCSFSGFFSYVGSILVTNHFLLLLIDRYILAIQKTITNYCDTLWSVVIFWTSSDALPPEALALSNPFQKAPFFAVLMYALYGHRRYFTFKRKYQQYGPCFRLSLGFLYDVRFMNKVIILRKLHVTIKTFTPSFFNLFSLSLKRIKRVVIRVIRKKLSSFTLQLSIYS